MRTFQIDINCDIGESYGHFRMGNDEAIFPYITSCNIACGFHGGDPSTIEKTIRLALQYNVQIGAHPSYPDLAGFGRRVMSIPYDELKAILKYQICALKGMVESEGGTLKYVKPHGALYNLASIQETEAACIASAIQELNCNLGLLGLPDSAMQYAAEKAGIPFIQEAFADRRYDEYGRLLNRQLQGAVITNSEEAVAQALNIVQQQQVITLEQQAVPVLAQSICIHGDHETAVPFLEAISMAFEKYQIEKKAFLLC